MKGLTIVDSGETMKFDGIISNVGNPYDAETGHFMCPVAGLYVFSVNLMSERYLKEAYGQLVKEGQTITRVYASCTETKHHYSQSATFIILECKAGERIWVESYKIQSKVYGERFSTFSGYILK